MICIGKTKCTSRKGLLRGAVRRKFMVSVSFICRNNIFLFLVEDFTGVVSHTRPSMTFVHISKLKFRWTSIHDNSPVLLEAVEFVMEAFD